MYYKYAAVGGMTLDSVYCVFYYNLYFIIFQFAISMIVHSNLQLEYLDQLL